MKIIVTGATGLVGSRLVPALEAAGHQVTRLVRDPQRVGSGSALWNPAHGTIDSALVESCDAVVNLAGDSIASGRWNEKKKARILHSRIDATRTLADALARSSRRQRTLVNASAVGYYGNRGDELLDETSRAGSGDFLSDVCRAWETATEPAAQNGTRVVLTRFGVILSGQGGALKTMLLPFQLGVGGKIGSGQQYMSWIAIDDVVGAIMHALDTPSLAGPVNLVAPQSVTNREYTRALGHVLHRPTIFPMPAIAARLAFGQMADELLLASQRVRPAVLEKSGYRFQYPMLEGALRHVLGRTK